MTLDLRFATDLRRLSDTPREFVVEGPEVSESDVVVREAGSRTSEYAHTLASRNPTAWGAPPARGLSD